MRLLPIDTRVRLERLAPFRLQLAAIGCTPIQHSTLIACVATCPIHVHFESPVRQCNPSTLDPVHILPTEEKSRQIAQLCAKLVQKSAPDASKPSPTTANVAGTPLNAYERSGTATTAKIPLVPSVPCVPFRNDRQLGTNLPSTTFRKHPERKPMVTNGSLWKVMEAECGTDSDSNNKTLAE